MDSGIVPNQEGLVDRGRYPAQRRKRRTKAEIAAARAETDSSRVDLARDDAVAGLTKLQQAKASENPQGEVGPSTVEEVPAGSSARASAAAPPSNPKQGTTPSENQGQAQGQAQGQVQGQAQGQSQAQSATAQPPQVPSVPPSTWNSPANQVDAAMKDAMQAFHYPNGSANPVGPYKPYKHPHHEKTNVKDAASLPDQGPQTTQQPRLTGLPNPNLANLKYHSPFDPNPRFVYSPYPPPQSTTSGASESPRTHAQPPSKRTTVWPERSRAAIAAAARDSLLSNPKNAGKSITVEDIITLLNKEPSYIDLCVILEKQWSFTFDRRQFAHAMLQAVPPAKANPSSTNGTTPQMKETEQQQQPAPTPSMTATEPANDYGSRVVDPLPSSTKRESVSKGKKKQTPSKEPTPPAEPQPTTKAEMARKRTFNDLVDLTVDSDEEERIKRVKAKASNDGREATSDNSRDTSRVRNGLTDKQTHPLLPAPAPKEQEPKGYDMSSLKNFTLSAAREALRTAEIAQPLDKSKARPLPVYNVKTLARDVLITAGKHETEAPLNFHLFGLKDIYKHVNNTTDLGSLRWDIMDPGGPAPGKGLEDLKVGEGGLGDGLGEELADGRTMDSQKGNEKVRQVKATRDTDGEETEDEPVVAHDFERGTLRVPHSHPR